MGSWTKGLLSGTFVSLFWALFAGPLFLIRNIRKYVRILAGILLVPASLLWIMSVIIGFFWAPDSLGGKDTKCTR